MYIIDPITVASPDFALCIVAVFVSRLLIGFKSLKYALMAVGLIIAISWLTITSGALLVLAIMPNYLFCRMTWGKRKSSHKTLFYSLLVWQICILSLTKIPLVSDDLGLAQVVGLSYITFKLIHLLTFAPKATNPFETCSWFAFLINPLTLIAGPIQSWDDHHKQIISQDKLSTTGAIDAAHHITTGLIKISILAPIFAGQGDFENIQTVNFQSAEIFVLIFSYYIFLFLDFSGYVNVVMGCGILIGYRLPRNFNKPYLAKDFQDFWGRWHITLGEWFRNNAFYPLMIFFNRSGWVKNQKIAVVVSLFSIFLLIGIWHGLAWNYLLFGVIHAFGVSINYYFPSLSANKNQAKNNFLNTTTGKFSRLLYIARDGMKLLAFQTLVAATFILLNNDVAVIWEKMS